jgi:2-phosphoglycerate kinase
MTDRLTLTRALESSGMQSQAAEKIATEIYAAIHDNVATKSDLAAARSDIKADIAAVRADMREMEQRIIIRLGGMIFVGTGLLIAVKYFG